jgi:3-oxoacyl-[acyl-carrier protein] reductase
MASEFSLDGKAAIVTGAGRGLGRAIALTLADAGADIVGAARTKEQIEETADMVRAKGRRCHAISCDVTDSAAVRAMVQSALNAFGRIDILVNNAGGLTEGFGGRPLEELSDQQWRIGIDTNLSGAMYCSRAVVPPMLQQGSGKIINIASTAGMRGVTNSFIYGSAKAALINFTRALTMTYAKTIQANVITPGIFPHDIPQISDWFKHGDSLPMGRLGRDEEIGRLAVFLASDLTSYMNGQIIVLDGGGLAGGHAPTGFAPVVPLTRDLA